MQGKEQFLSQRPYNCKSQDRPILEREKEEFCLSLHGFSPAEQEK